VTYPRIFLAESIPTDPSRPCGGGNGSNGRGTVRGVDVWAGLEPQFDWRPSQAHLLGLAGHVSDRRWHLCAPPGAGKTLIGLELARWIGEHTLVLAPTTAIRDQWRESTALFGAEPDSFTGRDPEANRPLTALTYQMLGNPGEAAAELRSAARRLWRLEIEAELGEEAAERRIRATETEDPTRARREVRRHVRALRRSLATGTDVGVPREALLGDRSVALVEQLAEAKLGCVVLDECHHLLDWWALVVAALVERLELDRDVAVVGLTATLPEPDSSREAENYAGLLGQIDAELPLAAMVAEGGVAPWRDGVRITAVTGAEQAFLEDWTSQLETDLDEHLVGEPFVEWAVTQVSEAAAEARTAARTALDQLSYDPAAWDGFWDRDPLAAAALHRWWTDRGLALPAGFDPPPGTEGPLGLDGRLTLLDTWLHDPLADIADEVRTRLGKLGSRYGLSFTTRGVRWGRSVADLVCARSAAKGPAAAEILAGEAGRRGSEMRALVVVERDTATTPPARARAVLGRDAGTAAQVLAALCARGEVLERGIVAVTGRGAWADALSAERVRAAMNVAGQDEGRSVGDEGCDIAGAVQLVGEGGAWTTARWLAAAEAALDDGAAQTLLATRGLVGEGWDHPPLNVLVDLSEAASRTAATQLRGRAIRLDPADPAKLASLWDVAVVHASTAGDWDRVRRRHRSWWGPASDGTVATGPAKLHPRLGLPEPPTLEERHRINGESLAAVADQDATREAWGRLDPAGVAATVVHMRSRRRPRRRVRTRVRDWRSRWARSGICAALAGTAVPATGLTPLAWVAAGAGAVAAMAFGATAIGWRRDEAETMQALAEAVLTGLVALGHEDLAPARVIVEADPSGGWVVTLDRADDDAVAHWAEALAETLGRLGTPRWMVAVGDRAWRVPGAVGPTKRAAQAFARAFRARMPGAKLLRAGEPRATELTLAAARERPDRIEQNLRWRGTVR
jgi:hypothetical protein